MKIRDTEYNWDLLEQFTPNDFYVKHKQELVIDFESAFFSMMDTDLPDLSVEQLASVSNQKTNLLMGFVSGHLNFFDPKSKVFKRINNEIGINTPSGLILPDKKLLSV